MTKASNFTPGFQFLPAGNDPREPTGIWRASGTAAGDTTGGENVLRATLVGSAHQRGWAAFFQVLQVTVEKANASAPVVSFQMEDFSRDPFTLTSYGTLRRTIQTGAGVFVSSGLLRDEKPIDLGYPVNGAASAIAVSFPNVNVVNDRFEAFGYFWLGEAAFLPGGPVQDQTEAAFIQTPNYPVGANSFYAQLRRGEPATIAAVPQVVQVPDASQARPARIGVSARASDQDIVQDIVSRIQGSGISIAAATARALGQSPAQINAQLAVPLLPGQKAAPGARYANITGRFDG